MLPAGGVKRLPFAFTIHQQNRNSCSGVGSCGLVHRQYSSRDRKFLSFDFASMKNGEQVRL